METLQTDFYIYIVFLFHKFQNRYTYIDTYTNMPMQSRHFSVDFLNYNFEFITSLQFLNSVLKLWKGLHPCGWYNCFKSSESRPSKKFLYKWYIYWFRCVIAESLFCAEDKFAIILNIPFRVESIIPLICSYSTTNFVQI